MSIRKDILRKLLNQYGEEHIFEIITSAGHRIQFVDGKYKFDDEDDVLVMEQVIDGANKIVYFSYDTFDIVEFDNLDHPKYAYQNVKPLELEITTGDKSITNVTITDIDKEARTGTLKYTINNYKEFDPMEQHRVKIGDESIMNINAQLVKGTTNQFTALIEDLPSGNVTCYVQYICGLLVVNSNDTQCNIPHPNRAPKLMDCKVSNITAKGSFTLTYTAVDEDGDAITHKLNGKEITPTKSGNNYTITITGIKDKHTKNELAVSDGKLSACYLFTVTLPENHVPVISNLKTSNANENGTCTITYTVVDVDGDTLTHKINGTVVTPTKSGNNYTINKTGLSVGNHTFKLVVTDGIAEANSSVSVTIPKPANKLPVISDLKVLQADASGTYKVSYNVVDADDPTLSKISHWLKVDNANLVSMTPTISGNKLCEYTGNNLSQGQHNIVIEVSDGKGTVASSIKLTIPAPVVTPEPSPQPTDKVVEKADK